MSTRATTGYMSLLPASLGQGAARRWPFIVCLVSVILIGGSPWLYSQLVPKIYYYQRSGSFPYLTSSEMIYNPFDMSNFTDEKAAEIFKCTTEGWSSSSTAPGPSFDSPPKECPSYFQFIHKDLAPWKETGITHEMIESAKNQAGFRVVILSGKLYVEPYYKCFLTRAVFTVGGLLLLLEKYKGQVPDVEFVFNCEDRPRIPKKKFSANGPPVLFAYDSNSVHYDIPFPDWSFWGWSELLISSWDVKRETIANGSQRTDWEEKVPTAYWSGNPWSGAPHRVQLVKCDHHRLSEIRGQLGHLLSGSNEDSVVNKQDLLGGHMFFGALLIKPNLCMNGVSGLFEQDWAKETQTGKPNSKLEDQCKHRYMIYTEGNGWSVSLKYILACGSPTLTIAPEMYDFFSRGLRPWVHYIPIRPSVLAAPEMCDALDKGVEFGEANKTQAVKIGKAGLDFMRNEIGMENVYNYMFHLLREYSQMLKFQPMQGDAHLLTIEHYLCLQENEVDKNIFQEAMKTMPTNPLPCEKLSWEESELYEPDWQAPWPAV